MTPLEMPLKILKFNDFRNFTKVVNDKNELIYKKRILSFDFKFEYIGVSITDDTQTAVIPLLNTKTTEKEIIRNTIIRQENIFGALVLDRNPSSKFNPFILDPIEYLKFLNMNCLLEDSRYIDERNIEDYKLFEKSPLLSLVNSMTILEDYIKKVHVMLDP